MAWIWRDAALMCMVNLKLNNNMMGIWLVFVEWIGVHYRDMFQLQSQCQKYQDDVTFLINNLKNYQVWTWLSTLSYNQKRVYIPQKLKFNIQVLAHSLAMLGCHLICRINSLNIRPLIIRWTNIIHEHLHSSFSKWCWNLDQ